MNCLLWIKLKYIAHRTEPLPKSKSFVRFDFLLVFCEQTNENCSFIPSGLINRNFKTVGNKLALSCVNNFSCF